MEKSALPQKPALKKREKKGGLIYQERTTLKQIS
jgi:hypothetical protein